MSDFEGRPVNTTPDTPPLMAQPMITNGDRSLGLSRGDVRLVLGSHELDQLQELLNEPDRWPLLVDLSSYDTVPPPDPEAHKPRNWCPTPAPAAETMLDGTVEPAEPRATLYDRDGDRWEPVPGGWCYNHHMHIAHLNDDCGTPVTWSAINQYAPFTTRNPNQPA